MAAAMAALTWAGILLPVTFSDLMMFLAFKSFINKSPIAGILFMTNTSKAKAEITIINPVIMRVSANEPAPDAKKIILFISIVGCYNVSLEDWHLS